jgi:acyl carrier protein
MFTATDDASAVIYARLREVLAELDIPGGDISFETELRADLDVDSAELVEIVAAVTDGDAPEGKALSTVATIGELVALLKRGHA